MAFPVHFFVMSYVLVQPMSLFFLPGTDSFLLVSQLNSVRGFAFDGDHDEAMAPIAGPCMYNMLAYLFISFIYSFIYFHNHIYMNNLESLKSEKII